MKRLLVVLMLIITLFSSSCGLDDVSEIEIINLKNGEKTVVKGDSEDINIITKALKNKEKTEEDVSDLFSYELLVKKENKTDYYKISFDIDNKNVYISQENKTYKINSKEAEDLFENENFSYIYIDSTLYSAFLDYNEETLVPNVEYSWNYKDINDRYIKKEGIIKGSINEDIVIGENDSLDIYYDKVPDSQVIKIYLNDKLVKTGTDLQPLIEGLDADGKYIVESHAQWRLRDDSKAYGNQIIKFNISVDRPASVNIITRENSPGNILIATIDNLNEEETAYIETEAVKVEVDMHKHKNKNYFICPIDLNIKPGEYELNVVINKGTNKEYTVSKLFNVTNKSFKTQYLKVSEEMNETNNSNAATYEFAQLVKPARTESVPEKLWEGTFIMPVDGRLTTDFAEIRYVNDEQVASRHSGLDLAAPLGTEVKAPNNGIVTFAMEGLLSPGNTVVIDHGMGLFTSYYHLDTIKVEKGQKVTKGDIIGTVGNTGFSTGPHLHYAVSIYNSYVNPYQTLSGIID